MNIGHIWAVCDIYEKQTGKPIPSSTLKMTVGVCRKDLREYERRGRLDVYYITDAKGTREKGYLRPKERVMHGSLDR